jgi:FMN phosphatase YigB (HAD superfamily)
MFQAIQSRHLMPDVEWNVVIDSSLVRLQKPDPQIYQLAQAKAQVPSNQILFIENSPDHLEVPKQLGWQTFWYDSAKYDQSFKELARLIEAQSN